MTRPFEGVKILDFTQVLAGPYASFQLALLGADVIKVERREGEDMRRTPLSREWADRGLAPGWQAIICASSPRRRPRPRSSSALWRKPGLNYSPSYPANRVWKMYSSSWPGKR